MIYQGSARYEVHEAILHTSATPTDWWRGKTIDQIVAEIRRWHTKDRGWRDIGYHRVIAPDGSIGIGRSVYEIGAHVMERNRGTIGICLVPVKTVTHIGTFEEFYTTAQRTALRGYLAELRALTPLRWVTGHNDYAAKLCPGFKVQTKNWVSAWDG